MKRHFNHQVNVKYKGQTKQYLLTLRAQYLDPVHGDIKVSSGYILLLVFLSFASMHYFLRLYTNFMAAIL